MNPVELPPADQEYLDATFPGAWSIQTEGPGKHLLLIEPFPIPEGWDRDTSTLMVLVPSGYPGSALDMFYFDPALARSNGARLEGLSSENHMGRTWQRWSRHYDWNPGFDTLVRHLEFIKVCLTDES